MSFAERWSRLTPGALTAAVMASGAVWLGDDGGLLLRVGELGELLGENALPAPIHSLSTSLDGERVGVVGGGGEVLFYGNGDLLFRQHLDFPAEFVLVGGDGDHLLALAPNGDGLFLNRFGREIGRIQVPGGVARASLVPRSGEVVAACHDGMLRLFSAWGKPLWETGLPPIAGPLAVDERGELILVPAHTHGAEAFNVRGEPIGAYDVGEGVRSVSCDAAGERILLATTSDLLVMMRRDATVICAERFPSPLLRASLSADGTAVLVETQAGYAHALTFSTAEQGPLVELRPAFHAEHHPRHLLHRRLFSPFTFFLQPRLEFAPDSSFLAVGGDRQNVWLLDLDGEEIARRHYAGTLIHLSVEKDRQVRVFGTQAVFRFAPGDTSTRPIYQSAAQLLAVHERDGGEVVALTEAGEVIHFPPGGDAPRSMITLPDDSGADLLGTAGAVAVAMKTGTLLVYGGDGTCRRRLGPWPTQPRLLASGPDGILVSVGKMLLLLDDQGNERFRLHLGSPPRTGAALNGTFVVKDESGAVLSVTPGGLARRAFSAGRGPMVPFADAGEGPGFLVADGSLLTAVHPNGQPRWRFRTPEEISFVHPSPDGSVVGVVAGFDLNVLSLTETTAEPPSHSAAARYLEFADG